MAKLRLIGWCVVGVFLCVGAGVADEARILFVERIFPEGLLVAGVDRSDASRAIQRAERGRLLLRERDGRVWALVDGSRVNRQSDVPIDIADPDLSYDASRVVFSGFSPQDQAWRIYEVGIDGSNLRKLTRSDRDVDLSRFGAAADHLVGYDDADPCYLPDGRICLVSTRLPGIAPDFRHRTTNLYMIESDGSNLHRITSERFGADTPTVDPTSGEIVYSRWWRSAPRLLEATSQPRAGGGETDLVLPGSPAYGAGPTGDGGLPDGPPVTGMALRDFPGLNNWFLASIRPDGDSMRMLTGVGLDRLGTQAYRPAFFENGLIVGQFLPTTPFIGQPGNFGLRLFRLGAVAPTPLGGPQNFFPQIMPAILDVPDIPLPTHVYASAAPFGVDRVVVSVASFGLHLNYDVYKQSLMTGEMVHLVGNPNTAELDALPVLARRVPPILNDGDFDPMDDFVPSDLSEAVDHNGTFTFLCENVFSNPPIDSVLPNSVPVGKKLFIEFFMNPQRTDSHAADEPILLERHEIESDGRIEVELPAGVPLFEVIRRSDGSLARGHDGQIFHVGGHNFGVENTVGRCVGCHVGHTLVDVPEEPAWTNLAPSAVASANNFQNDHGGFSPGNLIDRHTKKLGATWAALPAPENDGPALATTPVTLRWTVPIQSREIVLYGVRPDADTSTDVVVGELTIVSRLGGLVQEMVEVTEPVRVEGTSVKMNPGLVFDTLELLIDATDVSGHFLSVPSLPALAEVRVESKVLDGAVPVSFFVRGEVNCDGGINLVDSIDILNFLFNGGSEMCCQAAADTNADGTINITDAIQNLVLFAGATLSPGLFPECGPVAETTFTCDSSLCPQF